jgi:hypothetical protein
LDVDPDPDPDCRSSSCRGCRIVGKSRKVTRPRLKSADDPDATVHSAGALLHKASGMEERIFML